jgi:hypothetical protein
VTDAALLRADGTRLEIEDNKLYRVVAGLYSAQMLSVVGDKSFGILSIVPKTREGQPIPDFEAQIITDAEGRDIREWVARARYLQSFAINQSGLPQVPAFLSQAQGRQDRPIRVSFAAGHSVTTHTHCTYFLWNVLTVDLPADSAHTLDRATHSAPADQPDPGSAASAFPGIRQNRGSIHTAGRGSCSCHCQA